MLKLMFLSLKATSTIPVSSETFGWSSAVQHRRVRGPRRAGRQWRAPPPLPGLSSSTRQPTGVSRQWLSAGQLVLTARWQTSTAIRWSSIPARLCHWLSLVSSGLLAAAPRVGGELADDQPAGLQSGQPAGGQPGARPEQLGPRHTVSPGERPRELSVSGQRLPLINIMFLLLVMRVETGHSSGLCITRSTHILRPPCWFTSSSSSPDWPRWTTRATRWRRSTTSRAPPSSSGVSSPTTGQTSRHPCGGGRSLWSRTLIRPGGRRGVRLGLLRCKGHNSGNTYHIWHISN